MSDCSVIGMNKDDLDTPCLLVDLDVVEKNIKTMADYYRKKEGAALRPHQKGHRLPIIGKKQVEAGAKGVSMTSLGLAEYYAQCGFSDILVTNEVAGYNKMRRVATLSKQADVTVGVDSIENAMKLGDVAREMDTVIQVGVELYMGTGTCGVDMKDAGSLIKKITTVGGVMFKGVWWHQGSLADIINWEERKQAHFKTLDRVAMLKSELEKEDISLEIISGGFTCTWDITPEYGGLENVEVQAGSYVFSDWCSHESEGLDVFDYALTVLTRCISRPQPDEICFDAGMNACSDEHTDSYLNVVGFKIKGMERIKRVKQREELSMVKVEKPPSDIRIGDTVELIPPHSDTTAKLHDRYYGVRKGRVEAVFPNYGRGLL